MTASPRRGFTLLEAVVAFAIAAFAISMIVKAVGTGLGSTERAGRTEEALSRARSHLAALDSGAGLSPMIKDGDDGGGFRWYLAVTPVAQTHPSETRPTAVPPGPAVTLYAIKVAIGWQEDGREHRLVLDSAGVSPSGGASE